MPYSRSVLNRAGCRDKLVGPPAQSLKLVGADDDSSSTAARCNLVRFRLGKSEGAAGRIAPLCPAGLFE